MRHLNQIILAGILSVFCVSTALATSTDENRSPLWGAYDEAVELAIGSMLSDSSEALQHARTAEDIARTLPISEEQTTAIAQSFWLQAEALNRLNRAEEASPLIQRGLGLIGEEGLTTKLGADLIVARARNARGLGQDELALKSFHQAHALYAQLGLTRQQRITLQSLGSIYNSARDYDRTLEYYQRAEEIHPGDPGLDLASYNNQSRAHRMLGNYGKAIELAQRAVSVAESVESPILVARTNGNLAASYLEAGQPDLALAAADAGLAALDGVDGGEWEPIALAKRAEALAGLDRLEEAGRLMSLAFSNRDLNQTSANFIEAHRSAYEIFRELEQPEDSLAHLEAYKRMEDAARDIAAEANNVLVAAEFDFAAQELEIEKLASAQLRSQVELEQARRRQQFMLLTSLSGGVLLLTLALGSGLVMSQRSKRRIALANARLEETNEALDKANKVKTEFLATTSHEIRTPLNGILGLTEIMLNDESLDERNRVNIEQIHGAGDTLLAVVNDILDVATIESGNFEITESVSNVPKLGREVVGLFKETAEKKGLSLTFDAGDCPEAVLTDSMRIRQVLFNLVSNAVKFTENGGVHVALSVQATPTGDALALKVNDTGIGIPESEVDAIFETFHQVDGSRTRRFGGTGLGLSICQQIAEALGGNIALTSRVGQGSRFTVTIPLKRIGDVRETDRREAKTDITELNQLDVLVVEDNLLNRTVTKALIDKHVGSVTLTEDGVQALSAIQQKHFDLILMDKQMPNMDGITAIKTIRAMNDGNEDVYIIAVTADAYDGAREEILEAGADDYLAKPISADLLLESMRRAIDAGVKHSRAA